MGSTAPQYTGLTFPGPFFVPRGIFPSAGAGAHIQRRFRQAQRAQPCRPNLFRQQLQVLLREPRLQQESDGPQFYNTTSAAAVGVWTPSKPLTLGAGVFDLKCRCPIRGSVLSGSSADELQVHHLGYDRKLFVVSLCGLLRSRDCSSN